MYVKALCKLLNAMKTWDDIIVIKICQSLHIMGQNSQKRNIGNHSVRAGCKDLWESDTLGLCLRQACSLLVDANNGGDATGGPVECKEAVSRGQ